jgi:hypothetical protein
MVITEKLQNLNAWNFGETWKLKTIKIKKNQQWD